MDGFWGLLILLGWPWILKPLLEMLGNYLRNDEFFNNGLGISDSLGGSNAFHKTPSAIFVILGYTISIIFVIKVSFFEHETILSMWENTFFLVSFIVWFIVSLVVAMIEYANNKNDFLVVLYFLFAPVVILYRLLMLFMDKQKKYTIPKN